MKNIICEICGIDTDVEEAIDGSWLCQDCEYDYLHINQRDPKLIWFSRHCGMNLLDDNPKWKFTYTISFMGGPYHKLKFETTDRLAKIIWKFERPIWFIGRSLKKLRRKN